MLYIGLLRSDGTEPEASSGYRRTAVNVERNMLSRLLEEGQIVFPDVTGPGYGRIDAAAAWNMEEGGMPLIHWNLPEPTEVPAGVVPVIHRGRLWKGVDVKARVQVAPGSMCRAGRN